jgi:hypothetical protein
MKTIIKAMWIDSATCTLESYLPDNPKCFGLWIQLRIGPSNHDGAHDYSLLVCSPGWIETELKYAWKGAVWGRHMLIVNEYNLQQITQKIEDFIASCEDKDFDRIAKKLSVNLAWEFENYQP